jgi:hypothetical protein
MLKKKIDVLYILGTGSIWKNNELKYSLRSLEEYGKNIGRVFITGENPGFLSDEVIFNKVKDISAPAVNHMHKVRWTFENTNISDNILLNYDDVFFTKNVDISKYPYYYCGELPSQCRTIRGHTKALVNTRKLLENRNKPYKRFTVHCPIIYNRKRFLNLNKFWDKMDDSYYFSVRSFYTNYYKIKGQFLEDCVLATLNKEEMDLVKHRDCFSIMDYAFKNDADEFVATLYPNRSKYERKS